MHVLLQVRPEGAHLSDPGMPSSHAMVGGSKHVEIVYTVYVAAGRRAGIGGASVTLVYLRSWPTKTCVLRGDSAPPPCCAVLLVSRLKSFFERRRCLAVLFLAHAF